MQIQVHTDNNIDGPEQLTADIETDVASALERFSDHLTRVEVHLSDESAGRVTDADIRCMIEARPEGQNPVAVTDNAGSVDAAVNGALQRLVAMLTSDEGKQHDQHGRTSIGARSKE